jgi:hypothetical protein
MATLKTLPVSPRTKVFRAICSLLQHDPVLSNVIKPDNFRTWAGKSNDSMPFDFSPSASLRLTPSNGPEEWKYPDAMMGWLFITVDMLVMGTDADDQLNLWWAIERAIYPDTWALSVANVQALQLAGAYSGLTEFSQPAFDAAPQGGGFASTGQLKIQVILQLAG